jgi:N-methylhydantoinase B
MGACAVAAGDNGIHTHMTNSLNTPVEALEYAFPMRVRRYSLRRNSGGAGKHHGGDGIIKEVELLTHAEGTILSDRRRFRPYGLAGGAPGKPGRTVLIGPRLNRPLASKSRFRISPGERILIETPGGGGWGRTTRRG